MTYEKKYAYEKTRIYRKESVISAMGTALERALENEVIDPSIIHLWHDYAWYYISYPFKEKL